jgi:hypothetical protein
MKMSLDATPSSVLTSTPSTIKGLTNIVNLGDRGDVKEMSCLTVAPKRFNTIYKSLPIPMKAFLSPLTTQPHNYFPHIRLNISPHLLL